ncbi:MAG: DEAD/DEAH box helicase family protein, partial [Thermodesulfobacteriota bacterium]
MPTSSKKRELFVDVVVPLPVEGEFTYIVPGEFAPDVQVGKRVLVPFGKRIVTGYIVKIKQKADVPGLKPVKDLLDTTPLFDLKRLKFFRWLAAYYVATLGETLALIHPKFVNVKSERILELTPEGLAVMKGESDAHGLLKLIQGSVKIQTLEKRFNGKGLAGLLKNLKKDGLVQEQIKLKGGSRLRKEKFYRVREGVQINTALEGLKRAPVQLKLLELIYKERELSLKSLKENVGGAAGALGALVKKGFLEEVLKDAKVDALKYITPLKKKAEPEPNKDQREALKAVKAVLKKSGFNPFLLYGVTGSGKTLVYLKAIEEAMRLGKGAIVLVPEIALTPRATAYLTERFPEKVALMHSGLNESERFYQFQRILSGEASVVIGTRSAL